MSTLTKVLLGVGALALAYKYRGLVMSTYPTIAPSAPVGRYP